MLWSLKALGVTKTTLWHLQKYQGDPLSRRICALLSLADDRVLPLQKKPLHQSKKLFCTGKKNHDKSHSQALPPLSIKSSGNVHYFALISPFEVQRSHKQRLLHGTVLPVQGVNRNHASPFRRQVYIGSISTISLITPSLCQMTASR